MTRTTPSAYYKSKKNVTDVVILEKLAPGEEVTKFKSGRFRRIRTMCTVILDIGAKCLADGAFGGLRWIGSPHGSTPLLDSAVGLQSQHENLADTHEIRQFPKEGSLPMHGVKTLGLDLGQTQCPTSHDRETGFLNTLYNLALQTTANRIRLDNS